MLKNVGENIKKIYCIVFEKTASQLLLRNSHLHTFNSDCRTFNDYQTFNTTYSLYLIKIIYNINLFNKKIGVDEQAFYRYVELF